MANLNPFTRIVIIFVTFLFFYKTLSKQQNVGKANAAMNPAAAKLLMLIFTVFSGCFIFPMTPLTLGKALLLLGCYGTVALGLAALYGTRKKKLIYPVMLILTAAGILCRYVFEFEEIVEYTSFSFTDVVVYIAVIPAFTAVLYYKFAKLLEKMK